MTAPGAPARFAHWVDVKAGEGLRLHEMARRIAEALYGPWPAGDEAADPRELLLDVRRAAAEDELRKQIRRAVDGGAPIARDPLTRAQASMSWDYALVFPDRDGWPEFLAERGIGLRVVEDAPQPTGGDQSAAVDTTPARRRSHPLDAIYASAIEQAGSDASGPVWVALESLARAKTPPLASVAAAGIQWTLDADDKTLTRSAMRAYLSRRRRRA